MLELPILGMKNITLKMTDHSQLFDAAKQRSKDISLFEVYQKRLRKSAARNLLKERF